MDRETLGKPFRVDDVLMGFLHDISVTCVTSYPIVNVIGHTHLNTSIKDTALALRNSLTKHDSTMCR